MKKKEQKECPNCQGTGQCCCPECKGRCKACKGTGFVSLQEIKTEEISSVIAGSVRFVIRPKQVL